MSRYDDECESWSSKFKLIESIFQLSGGIRYIPTFRKLRVTMEDLILLDDNQLNLIGVEQSHVRKQLLQIFKDLPVVNYPLPEKITQNEYINMVNNITEHLQMITYSLIKECQRAKNIPENHNALLKPNLKVSTVILRTCDQIIDILDDIEKMQNKSPRKKKLQRDKMKIKIIGSSVILIISIGFATSWIKYWK